MRFHYQTTGAIGWITMSNPPTNALTHPVFADRAELLSFFENPGLKAVVLRGEGRHFCSGADPGSFADGLRDAMALEKALNDAKELLRIISFAQVPVAAAISGSCLGAGLEIALACHFRFAATTAMFGFPECGYALMPGLGGTITSGHQVLKRHLIDLILSGRMIGAEEALQIGLVDSIHPPKRTQEEALGFLESLTKNHPPRLIHAVMRSIHNGRRLPVAEALTEETRLFCELARDVVEGQPLEGDARP